MFMKFDLFSGNYHPDDFDAPIGAEQEPMPQQKMCINLKRIDMVSQSGQYKNIPIEDAPQEMRLDRPLRGARAQRRRQIFVIDADRFILHLDNGHQYTVMGKFDEFCEILSNFRERLETV